jgi:hypothetical protein
MPMVRQNTRTFLVSRDRKLMVFCFFFPEPEKNNPPSTSDDMDIDIPFTQIPSIPANSTPPPVGPASNALPATGAEQVQDAPDEFMKMAAAGMQGLKQEPVAELSSIPPKKPPNTPERQGGSGERGPGKRQTKATPKMNM